MKTEEQYESEHRVIFYAIVLVFDLMKQRILITNKQFFSIYFQNSLGSIHEMY